MFGGEHGRAQEDSHYEAGDQHEHRLMRCGHQEAGAGLNGTEETIVEVARVLITPGSSGRSDSQETKARWSAKNARGEVEEITRTHCSPKKQSRLYD